jgi:hypothetical protein
LKTRTEEVDELRMAVLEGLEPSIAQLKQQEIAIEQQKLGPWSCERS